MVRILFGVALGALGAYYMQQRPQREELERRMHGLQERTNAVLDESRQILNQTRGELGQALDAGRSSVQQKADRLRSAASGETGRERTLGA